MQKPYLQLLTDWPNPPTEIPPDLHSTQKCNEFAAFYIDKIEGIRRAINISTSNKNVGLPPCSGKNYVARMACFNVIDSQNLVETDTTKAIHLLPWYYTYQPL